MTEILGQPCGFQVQEEEMLAALQAAYEDACGKPPRGPRGDDPDWLAEQTRAALVATSREEAAAKSVLPGAHGPTPERRAEDVGGATGQDGGAALETEIKRRGLVPAAGTADFQGIPGASGFRGVARREKNGEWFAQIVVVGEVKHLGHFEPSARGEVDAALAYDAAARAAGRPEMANFLVNFTGLTQNFAS
jgi:hypothetical protein